MSAGIKVYNDFNQVIISDITSSFYYYGTAAYVSQQTSASYLGTKIVIYNTYTSKPIIPFVRPNTSLDSCSIIRVFRGASNYWQLEVIVLGQNAVNPTIHVFTTADAENWNSRFPGRDRKNGMKVLRSDGSVSFDSTVGKPLIIRDGIAVAPPTDPTNGGTDLNPTRSNLYSISGSMDRPMFGYFAMALAHRYYDRQEKRRDCTGIGYGGVCIGFSETEVKYEQWWALYRSALRIQPGFVRCGWVVYTSGYFVRTASSTSLSFFVPVLTIDKDNFSYGSVPYVNSSINITSQPVLLTDESLYI